MNTSCSLMSMFSGSLFTKRIFTRSGAAYVASRFLHSLISYLGSPKLKPSKESTRLPELSLIGEISLKIFCKPLSKNHSYDLR